MKSKLTKGIAALLAALVFIGGYWTGDAIAETIHEFRTKTNVLVGSIKDDTGNARLDTIELNAADLLVGELPDARLSSNVTTEGNTFNGASQLVQLDGSGNLPAVGGAALTGVSADDAAALSSDPADCAASFLAIGIQADGTAVCAPVEDTDGGVNASTSPATANALFDHEADASRHHTAIVNTNAQTLCAADEYLDGDGNCIDVIEELELASLSDLNTQLGTSIADGAHTTTLTAADITAATFPTGSFSFGGSTVTIAGIIFQPSKSTADICQSTCSGHTTSAGCIVRSGDDFSLYTSTANTQGSYRNERTGTGPC